MSDQLDQYESELGTKEDTQTTDKATEQPTEQPTTDKTKKEAQPEKTDETEQPKEDSETQTPADKKLKILRSQIKTIWTLKEKGAKRMRINNEQETNEAVKGFAEYMKSKGAKRDNVKSDDVGVTIPEDIQYQPNKEVKTVQDLSELVQKQKLQLLQVNILS